MKVFVLTGVMLVNSWFSGVTVHRYVEVYENAESCIEGKLEAIKLAKKTGKYDQYRFDCAKVEVK